MPGKYFDVEQFSDHSNRPVRSKIAAVLEECLLAVDPRQAILNMIQRSGNILRVNTTDPNEAGQTNTFDLGKYEHVYVVAMGKATIPMCQALEELLKGQLTAGCGVLKRKGTPSGGAGLSKIQVVEASHPTPDESSAQAAKQIVDLVQNLTEKDLVIAAVSGGASSLCVSPAAGLTLEDLKCTTKALLSSGADITEMNAVRKHCSSIKGGQLTRLIGSKATVLTLILSDVIGNDKSVIGGGPTYPDASTWTDVQQIVAKYGLEHKLPAAVMSRLKNGLEQRDGVLETVKSGDMVFNNSSWFIVGDNRIASEAAAVEARRQGWNTKVLGTSFDGEAVHFAKFLTALPLTAPPPTCFILGGETTVTLPQDCTGKGGRNQEIALAAATHITNQPQTVIVSLATDGTDGPTDNAGGIVDCNTLNRAKAGQIDVQRQLLAHNSAPVLQATKDLLETRMPTGTNVNDVMFVFCGTPFGAPTTSSSKPHPTNWQVPVAILGFAILLGCAGKK
eukprot:TRINITY_DN86178_c0_g1_i1.p1 TRINITY_DN86178_c0_g1~~TRINITY_DN86178_c0_g1_i1.p1  ORF type:complete len:505 (-),score=65.30 TRINITY_DN86178_c0_g1_i1:55-1569(-)